MIPANKSPSAVLDACFLIGFCAKERNKYAAAKAKLEQFQAAGVSLYAPGVVVGEVLFVLCGKLASSQLSAAEHAQALASFARLMAAVRPPPNGDHSLVERADQIRASYGCSRANDAIYLALAEDLMSVSKPEVVTFDKGMVNHAKSSTPGIVVDLLPVLPDP